MPISPLPVLDISLRCNGGQSFEIDLRFDDPALDAPDRLVAPCGPFDHDWYRAQELDSSETGEYGKRLGHDLLGDQSVKDRLKQWNVVVKLAGGALDNRALRVRLYIEPSALDESSLRWEALCDPESGEALFNGSRTYYFSRFLTSSEWQLVRQRPKTDGGMRALVAIANPDDLNAKYGMAPVQYSDELARAKANLQSIQVTALTPDSPTGRATLTNICAQLRAAPFDLLYLVCHGALRDPEPGGSADPVVWLEADKDASNSVASAVTDAPTLVRELGKLPNLPRIIVLASCQSAGTGQTAQTGGARTADTTGSMTALAPRLAVAGVPAAVAMQGNILMDTVAKFMPVFFRELSTDGQVDRAMAVARGTIGGQSDYWAPVLYTRLRDASIWYEPGFAGGQSYDAWNVQIRYAKSGTCVPLLGPGMLQHLVGPQREIVRKIAEDVSFPLASSDRDNLPSVAQYLTMKEDAAGASDTYQKWMRKALRDRDASLTKGAATNDLLMEAGAKARKSDPNEPHAVLASKRFQCDLYVTTNPDTLLEAALAEAGRTPKVNYLRWYDGLDPDKEGNQVEWTLPWEHAADNYRPTAQNPLVYHLFGLWTAPDALILSEDDYFDYLIGSTLNKTVLPRYVLRSLAALPLLFMGFQIDEWSFRVLFRQLKSQQGNALNLAEPAAAAAAGSANPVQSAQAAGDGFNKPMMTKKRHIGAQIGPEQDRMLNLDGARKVFQDDFKSNDIDLYWGSVADFTTAFMRAAQKQDDDD